MNILAGNTSVRYHYIETDEALIAACQRWSQSPALALDTEFMRVTTYYPKAALFQVADGNEVVLVDPLAISNWDAFRLLLTDPRIIKIFHSCSEDLLVFLNFLGVMPAPIFDTQIASSMLESGLSVSYQNLVKRHTGIELPKAETRSDWLQRPLTADQMEYAALDVVYLHQIWQEQKDELERLGRSSWLDEECAHLHEQYADEISGDYSLWYQNFKAAWQLGPQQLAALQKLAAWREKRARLRDRPRSWIIRDNALFAFASSMISSKAQMALMEDVNENFVRFEGEQVLALIAEARLMPEADCPLPLPRPLTQGQKNRLRKARELVELKAAELGVSPELLGRQRSLQALLYALAAKDASATETVIPAELRGWRKPLILDAVTGALRS